MKRTFVIILAALAAATLFGVLVHAVLVASHLSEPAATTIYEACSSGFRPSRKDKFADMSSIWLKAVDGGECRKAYQTLTVP